MFFKIFRIIFFANLLPLLILADASANSNDITDRFKLSGFGTLGVVSGGDEELGFQRDWSRGNSPVFDEDFSVKQDSLLGLQLDARMTDNLKGAVQLIARDRLDNSLGKSVEWAFLGYDLTPNTRVRAGRMGVDLFMLSENRNVDFSYLWARPPVEFYGPIAFDNFDGMDMTHIMPLWDGDLRFKVFGGVSKNNTITGRTGESSLDLKPLYGASVIWEDNTWLARISLASGELDSSNVALQPLLNYLTLASQTGWPEAASISEDLELSGKSTYYYAAGLAYDNAPWQVQSEVNLIESEYDFFLPVISAYVSVGHQFGPVTPYFLAALAKNTEDSGSLNSAPSQWTPLQKELQGIKDSYELDQKSLSLGFRWDIHYDLALKLQWDHHWVKQGGSLWYQQTGVEGERTLDTFSLNLNFVF